MYYRIKWKSLKTGIISNGEWFDQNDKQLLEENIIIVNKKYKKYKDEIYHWLENSNYND